MQIQQHRSASRVIPFLLGMIPGLVIGGGLAWYYLNTFAPKNTSKPVQTTSVSQPSAPASLTSDENIEAMTLPQMTAQLQQVQGEQFEKKYLLYYSALKNYGTGMSRLAKDKAIRTELKAFAAEDYAASDAASVQLLQWQKLWGYQHH